MALSEQADVAVNLGSQASPWVGAGCQHEASPRRWRKLIRCWRVGFMFDLDAGASRGSGSGRMGAAMPTTAWSQTGIYWRINQSAWWFQVQANTDGPWQQTQQDAALLPRFQHGRVLSTLALPELMMAWASGDARHADWGGTSCWATSAPPVCKTAAKGCT